MVDMPRGGPYSMVLLHDGLFHKQPNEEKVSWIKQFLGQVLAF